MAKILIWADAGCTTGFGIVTHEIATRMCKDGHDVHILAINYKGDPWDAPYKLYPAALQGNFFGLNRLKPLYEQLQPDLMFMLNDLDVIYDGWEQFDKRWPVRTLVYFPVDATDWPKYVWQPLQDPLALLAVQSNFGKAVVKNEAGLHATTVWHGVDHNIFLPVSKKRQIMFNGVKYTSKESLKSVVNMQNKFVVLATNRNTHRKNYPDTLRVFAEFHRRHHDSKMLIHAFQKDEGGDLRFLIERYGLQDAVAFSNPRDFVHGVPKEVLSIYYNLADVKISMSLGEGFGMTDLEAIACGTPVVAQDFSATSEVVGGGGILIKPLHAYTAPRMADYRWPDVSGFLAALEHLYLSPRFRKERGQVGYQHAQQFSWDKAYEKLRELIGRAR